MRVRRTCMWLPLFLILTSVGAGQGVLDDILARLRQDVRHEQAYQFGQEVQFTMSGQETVRLACSANPYGVEEVLAGRLQPENVFYIYGVMEDGTVTGGGSQLPRLRGAYRQIWGTPYLCAATWEHDADEITVSFQIQHEKSKNKQLLRKFEAMSNVSKGIQNVVALTGEIPRLTPLEQVEGFVRLWSEIKYNFAFFDQVPEVDWDQMLVEYLPKVRREHTKYDYYRLLQRCVAQLRDGHTNVWGGVPAEILDCPPMLIAPVEGKAVIVDLAGTEELRQADVGCGWEVTHVDSRAVETILQEDLYPFISASTPQARDRKAYAELLDGPLDSQVTVSLREPDGTVHLAALTRRSPRRWRPWSPMVEHRPMSEQVTYIALRSFGSSEVVKQFDEVLGKIGQARGLILDVRENGGGSSNIGYQIIGRLIDKPLASSRWKTRQYMPAFRAWGRPEKWYEGTHGMVEPRGDDPFLGPVVVLVGPGTVSSAEDFLIPLHASGRATLVGERTAGTTGQPLFIKLPGGGGARICTKRDTYPDGREFVGVGVIPDVEVHPTQADIAAGRDTVLEKALEVMSELLGQG